jgi:ABC-type transport system involved in Fe-S cluster assembly fused permease/ATPase subunit
MLSMMANMIFRMAAVNSGWVFQPKKQFWDVEYVYIKRMVGWKMNFIFPYIGNNTPN